MDDRVLVYRGADQPDMSVINPESDVWQHIKVGLCDAFLIVIIHNCTSYRLITLHTTGPFDMRLSVTMDAS